MTHQFRFLPLLCLLALLPLRSQTWDPARNAQGWAFQEVDGSLIFFDPPARSLRTWMKGTGLVSSLKLTLPEPVKAPAAKSAAPVAPRPKTTDYDAAGALLYGTPSYQRKVPQASAAKAEPEAQPACEAKPERWVLDTYNRVWMVCDSRLAVLGKDGAPEITLDLPGQVEDMVVGRDGLYLLYRSIKPVIEKRDLRSAAVLWTYGDRNQLKEEAAHPQLVPLNRMALGADDSVFLAEGASLAFTVLDPARGPKNPGQVFFTCQDAIPPRAVLGRQGRGPMLTWAGRDVIFGAFTPAQVKSCGAPDAKGLVLARFDLAKGTLAWVTTPLPDGHLLVGLLDTEAVFLAPGGGLAFAPIH